MEPNHKVREGIALESVDPFSKSPRPVGESVNMSRKNWHLKKKCRLRTDRIPLDRDVKVKRRAFLEG